jgi:hypothetical protein
MNFGKYRSGSGGNYGVMVSIAPANRKGIASQVYLELQYNYQQSPLRYTKYDVDSSYDLGTLRASTFLAGASTEFNSRNLRPFAGMLLGVTLLEAGVAFPDISRFTISFVCGTKMSLTPYMGLKVQVQLLMPVIYDDVDVGWEPGRGITTGIAPNGVILCANFSGGIYFQFK